MWMLTIYLGKQIVPNDFAVDNWQITGLLVCVCVYICVANMCVYVYVCTHYYDVEAIWGVSSLIAFHLNFWAESLTETKSHQFSKICSQWTLRTCLSLLHDVSTDMYHHAWLFLHEFSRYKFRTPQSFNAILRKCCLSILSILALSLFIGETWTTVYSPQVGHWR